MISFARIVPAALSIVIFLAGCSLAEDVTPPPGYQEPTAAPQAVSAAVTLPQIAPDPANGASIFAEKCAPCHGSAGMGDGPQSAQLPNPAAPIGSPELARAAKPSDWFTIVTQGQLDQFMPGFSQSLSDQQRWDVIAYVFTLSKPQADLTQGAEIYSASCASCHGAKGKGDGPQASGAKMADFTDPGWQAAAVENDLFNAVTSGKGQSMPAFSTQLTSDQRWAAVDYIRTLGNALQPLASAGTPSAGQNPTPAVQPTSAGAAAVNTQGTPSAGQAVSTAGPMGAISGQITNGSGGPVPTGMMVTLHGYDSMQETVTQQAVADSSGKYAFPRVDVPSGRVFMVSVSYNGTVFNSQVVSGQAGPTAVNLPVSIYEPTTDASTIVVDRMHIFFDFSNPGFVQVVQLNVISNSGNKAVVSAGPGKPVLEFGLPAGATNLQFQQGALGGRYVSTANGFGDTQSVPPGTDQDQILFAYELPYNRKADIVLPVTVAVNSAVIMVPKGGVQAQGTLLQDGGDRDVQGITFHLYTADHLVVGTNLKMTLSGDPNQASAASLVSGTTQPGLIAGLLALAAALVAAFLWFMRLRKTAAPRSAPAAADNHPATPEPEEPEMLIDAIIALDDKFKAGELPEPAYRQRRMELKARLAERLG